LPTIFLLPAALNVRADKILAHHYIARQCMFFVRMRGFAHGLYGY
jgi:hypothetical protein